jgi:NADPH-dependent 2,4-dienoyl-CoA reductase/sulfur reductase-like enzyme
LTCPSGELVSGYDRAVKSRIVILGAGFGGLELATTLSEALGDDVDVTLIDQNDAFVFGYSKLDVMFGRTTPDAVRLAYRDIAKPGVRFLRQTITAIDPDLSGDPLRDTGASLTGYVARAGRRLCRAWTSSSWRAVV